MTDFCPYQENLIRQMFQPSQSNTEFCTDLEYQESMDTAYHNWLQPQYDKARKEWEKKVESQKNRKA